MSAFVGIKQPMNLNDAKKDLRKEMIWIYILRYCFKHEFVLSIDNLHVNVNY